MRRLALPVARWLLDIVSNIAADQLERRRGR